MQVRLSSWIRYTATVHLLVESLSQNCCQTLRVRTLFTNDGFLISLTFSAVYRYPFWRAIGISPVIIINAGSETVR